MNDEKEIRLPDPGERGTNGVYTKLYNEWFEKVLHLYALGFILVVVLEAIVGILMGFYGDGATALQYTMRRVVLPAVINGFLILMNLEIIHRQRASDRLKNCFTLFALFCISFVLACVHNIFDMRFSMFLVPMVSAIAFLDVTMLRVVAASSICGIGLTLVVPQLWRDTYSLTEQIPNAVFTVILVMIISVVERVIVQLFLVRESLLAETVRENQQLGKEVETDDLTGLYNRKGFIRHAQQMMTEQPDAEYTLLLADVEGFRNINERFGEQRADELLGYLGSTLSELTRGKDDICGRYGGDQFALLLRDCLRDSEPGLRDFDRHLRENCPIQGVKLNYGICQSIGNDTTVVTACDRARLALRTVKDVYNENIAVYHTYMTKQEESRRFIENSMRGALESRQFVVYYQPKHDANTGTLIGAEALVRWNHPENGLIPPDQFVPVMEKNGFISYLDNYVWQTVCGDLRKWIDSGVPVVPVSVNASRRDFLQREDMSYLLDTVKQYGIDRKFLHLEVTESLYTDDAETIIPRVSLLRDAGIAIEMDDFGTGYSSLGMLHKLPLDVMKLDMSFIRDLDHQKDIVQMMIFLARSLNLQTVAEGVETARELEILKELGCDCIQGYYFSCPLPEKEFEDYLREHAV